jgi:hypothetical protein
MRCYLSLPAVGGHAVPCSGRHTPETPYCLSRAGKAVPRSRLMSGGAPARMSSRAGRCAGDAWRRGSVTKFRPAVGGAYRRRHRFGRPWRRRTSRIADNPPPQACSSTFNQTKIESAYDLITRSVTECMPTSHIQCRTHEQATSSAVATY